MLAKETSLVDSSVILKRIGQIRKCVATLETIRRKHTKKQFLNDEMVQAAAERNVQVASTTGCDMPMHCSVLNR